MIEKQLRYDNARKVSHEAKEDKKLADSAIEEYKKKAHSAVTKKERKDTHDDLKAAKRSKAMADQIYHDAKSKERKAARDWQNALQNAPLRKNADQTDVDQEISHAKQSISIAKSKIRENDRHKRHAHSRDEKMVAEEDLKDAKLDRKAGEIQLRRAYALEKQVKREEDVKKLDEDLVSAK